MKKYFVSLNHILGRNIYWAIEDVTVINVIWVYFYTFKGLTVIWFITSNLSCHPHFQVLIVLKFKMQEFPVSQKTSFITIDHPWQLSVCFAFSYTVSIFQLVYTRKHIIEHEKFWFNVSHEMDCV